MGYAKQVVGRAGTKGAFTRLHRCKKCRFTHKDDFHVVSKEENGAREIAQSAHELLLCILVLPVNMKQVLV